MADALILTSQDRRHANRRKQDWRRAAAFTGGVVLLLIAAFMLFWPTPSGPDGQAADESAPGSVDGSSVIGSGPDSVEIEGDTTDDLVPGYEAPIDLRLINLGPSDFSIVELTVTVKGINAPNATTLLPCTGADFVVRQMNPSAHVLDLPSKSARTLTELGLPRTAWPTIIMLNRPTNQDGCQDATLALTYTGSATVDQP